MATGQSFDIVVVGAGPAGLAAAIEAAKRGARTLVVDENNKPGGVFCGIGRCTDCAMTVDGIPNVRTCVTPVKAGMVITSNLKGGEE